MPPRQYSIAEARDRLPAIVHDAEKGRPVELTRRGKPVAVLLSSQEYERLTRPRARFWTALQDFRRTHDVEASTAADAFAGTRDRAPGREAKW